MEERVRSGLNEAVSARALPFNEFSAGGEQTTFPLDLVQPVEHPPLHPDVAQAAIAALDAGETRYTSSLGIEPVRQAIAERSTLDGFPATAAMTMVTNGGSEALYLAIQTLTEPDARVTLLEPALPELRELVRFAGGTAEVASPDDTLDLDGVSLVVVPVASDITGNTITDKDLVRIVEHASATGTTVILDRRGAFDTYEPVGPFSRPDLLAEAITIGSLSGIPGLAGWRAGYVTAPETLMPRLADLKGSMSISTTTPTQFAALAVLEDLDAILRTNREWATARCDRATTALSAAGLTCVVPAVFPGILIDVQQSGLDDVEAARRLAEAGVRVEAASTFGASLADHLRIDLRASENAIRDGAEQIARVLTGEAR